jgi:hypothetical protein
VREQYLQKGLTLPAWFTRPEIAAVLAEAYPPRHRQGFCLWFTGIDDPYEPPHDPEIVIETTRCSAEENAARILAHLIT